jgi:transglutaminase-like putative cysteine protease
MQATKFALTVLTIGMLHAAAASAQITGLGRDDIPERTRRPGGRGAETSPPSRVFLLRAEGNLDIVDLSSASTYEAYFHIPVPFAEQVPIVVEVESPDLIDYRFLQLSPPNVMVAARMRRKAPSYIHWTTWVLVKENTYADLPSYVPIPTLEELPDSVRQWLAPTDCAQRDAPIVQQIAAEVRGTTANLIELADSICSYCYRIPWEFPHTPAAFDAVYALNWGNSCTGHAHAGAALFRANGVPARSLLNMPTWFAGDFDMHWIIDYFVPQYGWVRMETSGGMHPTYAQEEIVTLACNPEDEFPLFFPCGIEGAWHTSDPVMGMLEPNWAGAHHIDNVLELAADPEQIECAHALTLAVFTRYVAGWGITLAPAQQAAFQAALDQQMLALESLQAGDLSGYTAEMEEALAGYEVVTLGDTVTIFYDDCEQGVNGWTHGGTGDEWELGTPTFGPSAAHSGANCWGTDLDDTYENNANCWLLSAPIDLSGLACGCLSFWVWNWVQDITQGYVNDPLWMEITTDGVHFVPLCSYMGGVNDDALIPDVGGWSRLVLDLQRYTGSTVRLRFRFRSDGSIQEPGSYLDDIRVYGRRFDSSGIGEEAGRGTAPAPPASHPNPFRMFTSIAYDLAQGSPVDIGIYDVRGRRVRTLVDREVAAGHHVAKWDGRDDQGNGLSSGVYLCRIETQQSVTARKLVLLE